jgi:hypothetical protein
MATRTLSEDEVAAIRAELAGERAAFGVNATECCCGCGLPAPLARSTSSLERTVKGEPKLWLHAHRRAFNPATSYAEEDRGYATPCWVWQRGCNDKGYGLFRLHGKRYYAHRWFYEQRHGPSTAGTDLDHKCRITRCVNPDHLEPVSHAENMRRGINTKLTPDDVRAIRRAARSGTVYREIAAMYGISRSYVGNIVARDKWADLPD